MQGAGLGRSAPRRPLKKQVLVELLSIALLTGVYLIAFQGPPRYLDAALGLAAVVLIGLSYRRTLHLWQSNPPVPLPYGQRLRAGFGWTAAFTVPAALLFFAVGLRLGYLQGGWPAAAERVLNWHVLPAMGLYLLWGLAQQFLFEFYLLGRLMYLLPAPAAVGLLAVIFSAVHFPRFVVMAAVLIAALVWANIYRCYRSLLPLAVSHAILGTTLHYWIFGGDLWAQWVLHR